MNIVKASELAAWAAGIGGTAIISVELRTEARLNKKCRETGTRRPWPEVIKLAKHTCMLGGSYENAVNNRRAKEGVEGEFEAESLAWGEHISQAVISKDGDLYIQLRILHADPSPVYVTPAGETIPADAIKPYLPPERKPGRQGVEDEVLIITPKVASIVAITHGGVRYSVVHDGVRVDSLTA